MNCPLLIFQNKNKKTYLKNFLIVYLLKKRSDIHHKKPDLYPPY